MASNRFVGACHTFFVYPNVWRPVNNVPTTVFVFVGTPRRLHTFLRQRWTCEPAVRCERDKTQIFCNLLAVLQIYNNCLALVPSKICFLLVVFQDSTPALSSSNRRASFLVATITQMCLPLIFCIDSIANSWRSSCRDLLSSKLVYCLPHWLVNLKARLLYGAWCKLRELRRT